VNYDATKWGALGGGWVDAEALEAIQEARRAPAGAMALHRSWLRPRVEQTGWKVVQTGNDGDALQGRIGPAAFTVIWSLAYEQDGALWLHVSASHRHRIPQWAEMAEVKRVFVGDRWACQLHPPDGEYVNLHDRVLHLFAPFSPEAWPLPDFTAGLGTI
jgi:hypothetical protein